MVAHAHYLVNSTGISEAERAYLRKLASNAAKQDLDEDLRGRVRAVSAACVGVAAVAVGLRFLARRRQAIRPGVDDWAMVGALLVLAGNLAMNIVLAQQGLGLHSGALSLPELQRLDQTVVGAEILFATGTNLFKIALLLFYMRVFRVRSVRLGGYLCGGFSTAWNLACILLAVLQCLPLSRLWMPWVEEGFCIDPVLRHMCISIPDILSTVVVLWLPMPYVLGLRFSPAQWACIVAFCLLGGGVVFVSAYRFRIMLLYDPNDAPYSLADGCVWNVVEISSGIVAGSLPALGAACGNGVGSGVASIRGMPSIVVGQRKMSFPATTRTTMAKAAPRPSSTKGLAAGSACQAPARGVLPSGEPKKRVTSDFALVPKHLMGHVEVSVRYSPIPRRMNQSGDAGSVSDDFPLTAIRQRTDVELTVEQRKSYMALLTRGIR